jgi:thiamine biosynthesis lipoprotein
LVEAEDEIHRLEAVFSRFRPESELSTLNREGSVAASSDLLRVVQRALEARERTDGRVDPTVYDAMLRAGYDRSFDELSPEQPDADCLPGACGGQVHIEGTVVTLGPGVKIDLGGIAKGDAAERACELLAPIGPCLANLGGDLAVRGCPASGPWLVGVETPEQPLTIALLEGGLATSGRDRRRWLRGGHEQHHVIDPATGHPAETDLLRVTAIGHDAVAAEMLAKSLLLAGTERALAEADAESTPCILLTAEGELLLRGIE